MHAARPIVSEWFDLGLDPVWQLTGIHTACQAVNDLKGTITLRWRYGSDIYEMLAPLEIAHARRLYERSEAKFTAYIQALIEELSSELGEYDMAYYMAATAKDAISHVLYPEESHGTLV